MSSQTTTTISNPRRRPQWWAYRWVPAGLLAAAALVFIVAQLSVTSPATVSKVTFRNNTPYDLLVSASGADREGVTALGTAVAHSSTEIDDVIDQGDRWVFHFEGQARDAGAIEVTRHNLASRRWTFTIPDAIGARLHAEGAKPSPAVGSG